MNRHQHRKHHKKESGNGKYIAGIVASLLVIIAAAAVAVWTVTGGFGGSGEEEVKQAQNAQVQSGAGADSGTQTEEGQTGEAQDDAPAGDQEEGSAASQESDAGGQAGDRIAEIIEDMTLEEKVCQLFMVTPEAITGVGTATQAGTATQEAIERYPVGGVIYFAKNLQNPQQTRSMLANTQEYATERMGFPVFLSVDEEGGQVARVGRNSAFGVERIGNMSDVGSRGDTEEAYRIGTTIGAYLSDLGFNMDAAPDTDVLTNPENEVVKYRSFGSDPELVADMAQEELRGLKEEGIIGMYKHFPGHGGTTADSHEGYAYVDDTLEELEEGAFVPFQRGIDEGIQVIMVSHISCPNVTGDNTPATLSERMITEILREDMGFDEMVITDALGMGAITQQYSSSEAAVAALKAGADMLLMPEDFQSAYQGVLDAVENGTVSEERVEESVRRILEVKLSME